MSEVLNSTYPKKEKEPEISGDAKKVWTSGEIQCHIHPIILYQTYSKGAYSFFWVCTFRLSLMKSSNT